MKMKTLSIALALIMMVALLPSLALTAIAEDDDAPIHTFISDSGIDYTMPDILIEGSVGGFVINLSKEKLIVPDSYTIAAFSTDGTSWRAANAGMFSDANFPKLLDRGLTLRLTDKFDASARQPATDAQIVSFDRINQRPSAPRVAVNYAIGADLTGATPGHWVLIERKGTSVLKAGLEIAPADSTGRTVDEYGYGRFFEGDAVGIPVQPMTGGKAARFNYFARTAPTQSGDVFTAASKPVRVRATSEQKPTRYRANYKTETLRMRSGDLLFAGTPENIGIPHTDITENTASITAGTALRLTGQRGATVSLSNYLSTNPETVIIRRGATAKRAASVPQVYTLAPRAAITQETIPGKNGKLNLGKKFEVHSGSKWGKLPKVTADSTHDIRTRPTARGTGSIDTGFAASAVGDIEIVHGVWNEARNRSGILRATIYPKDRHSHSITDVVVDVSARTVSVEVSAGANAILEVSIIEVDQDVTVAKVLASGQTTLEEPVETGFVPVTVTSFASENFIVAVRLLDRNGMDLCDPYFCIKQTHVYKEFEETTLDDLIADFGEERVISLDEYDDANNILATTEEAIIINAGEGGKNNLTTIDEEKVYMFSNADSVVTSLKVGDRVIVMLDDGQDFVVIRVREVTANGSDVTLVSETELDLTEFFDFVKIDMVQHLESDTPYIMGEDENAEPEPFEAFGIMPMSALSRNYAYGGKLNKVIASGTGNLELNAELGIGPYFVRVVEYSFYWNVWWERVAPLIYIPRGSAGVNLYIKLGVGAGAEIDVSATYTNKPADSKPMSISIFKGVLPPVWGFTGRLDIDLIIDWNVNAAGHMNAHVLAEAGVIYNNGSVQTYTTRSAGFEPKFEGAMTFTIGPRINGSLGWLGIINGTMMVHPKVQINANAYYSAHRARSGPSHHMCDGCAFGEARLIMDVHFTASYSLGVNVPIIGWVGFARTFINENRPNFINISLFSFYFSFVNHRDSVHGGRVRFDWGSCPNFAYQTTINAHDHAGRPMPTASVTIRNSSGNTIISGIGSATEYLYPGTYFVTAVGTSQRFANQSFVVTNQASTITITGTSIPVTGVTLNKSAMALFVDDTETLTATITPADATYQRVDWHSSSPAVASVTSNGVVTAISEGQAIITATTVDGNRTAICTVTVSRRSQTMFWINDPGVVTYGDTPFTLSTTGGSAGAVTYEVISGDAVSISGNSATILKAGNVRIRATRAGSIRYLPVTETIDITVNRRSLSNVSATLSHTEFTYNASEREPVVIVTDSGAPQTIRLTDDYIVTYSNNINASTDPGSPVPTVTISAVANGNYVGDLTRGFTINKAPLRIQADDKSIAEGAAPPHYTYTISDVYAGVDYAYGQTAPMVISGSPLLECEYEQSWPRNSYAITISQGSLIVDNNYALIFRSGELSVGLDPQNPALSLGGDITEIYGESFTLTPSGGSGDGRFSFTPPATEEVIKVTDFDENTGIITLSAQGVGVADISIRKAGDSNFEPATSSIRITIGPRDISNVSFALEWASQEYNGVIQRPTAIVSDGSIPIQLGADYTVAHNNNNANAGTYTVTITANPNGNYTGNPRTANFTIDRRPITITPRAGQSKVYGNANPTYTFDSSEPLVAGNSFSGGLARASGENVNTYAFNIGNLSAGNNYTLTLGGSVNFAITPRSLSNATVTVLGTFPFNGSQHRPPSRSVTVTDSGANITTEDWDITGYGANINAGTNVGSVTITGTRNYTGTRTVNFTIAPRNISNATVTVPGTFTFNGSQHRPTSLTVTDSATITTADWNITGYGTNINAGTNVGSVTITGTRNYTGTRTVNFTIDQGNGGTILGSANLQSVGNRSLTVTPVTTQAGFVVEYGLQPAGGAVGWGHLSNTFTGLANTTYTIWARTQGNTNLRAGVERHVGTISHTGWRMEFLGNISARDGNPTLYVRYNSGAGSDQISQDKGPSAGGFTRPSPVGTGLAVDIAPWMMDGINLFWAGGTTSRRININWLTFRMWGNSHPHGSFIIDKIWGSFDSNNGNEQFFPLW
jgi:hypothetical protein